MKKDNLAMKILFWVLTAGMTAAVFVLIFGGMNGWFVASAKMDAEDYCAECGKEYSNISAEEYERMIEEGKSFVLLIDQAGCTTADKLRGFLANYAKENNLRVYRMMFSEMKKTPLYGTVRHYPSVVVFNKGKALKYLRADEDEDAEEYNDENEFREWINRYIAW